FRRGKTIPFSAIKSITYGYDPWSTGSWFSWTYDSLDIYTVGLRLRDGGDVHLFNFLADGTFPNQEPLPDWMNRAPYASDFVGTQDEESKAFAELLSRAIGVPITPPSWG